MIFDPAVLAQLRKTQAASMMHACTIEPYIVGEDGTISYGEPVCSPCGFQSHSDQLTGRDVYESITAAASIRLPYGTQVGMKDRITLIRAYDRVLDPPQLFEVVDLPNHFGPSGVQVTVREVFS